MNKKYSRPKAKVIRLHMEQAILQVCKVGGVYLHFGAHVGTICAGTGVTFSCEIPVRGKSGTLAGNLEPLETIPS